MIQQVAAEEARKSQLADQAMMRDQPLNLNLSETERSSRKGERSAASSHAGQPAADRKQPSSSAFVPPGGVVGHRDLPQGVPPHLYPHGEIPIAFGQTAVRFPVAGLPMDPQNLYPPGSRQAQLIHDLHQHHLQQQIMGSHR